MTNTQRRTVYREDVEHESEINPVKCCCSIFLFSIGLICCIVSGVLLSGLRLILGGSILLVFGLAMVLGGLTMCPKFKDDISTRAPAEGDSFIAETIIHQRPFLEEHTTNGPSAPMETDLHVVDVVCHNQPSAPVASNPQPDASYRDDPDPNCSPPPFSESFAYPLSSTSQSSEPAPPSYEEAMNT
uniref:Brain protein I3 n=1 Tax=Phallusia mammillata TaxID=59560 RepID=A0A6F9D786_9ASCI|nr:brain protein I3 [Phallusia mammillata]